MSSPPLDAPVRDRKQAALDHARWALAQIERNCHEHETVKFVREHIARVRDILNA